MTRNGFIFFLAGTKTRKTVSLVILLAAASVLASAPLWLAYDWVKNRVFPAQKRESFQQSDYVKIEKLPSGDNLRGIDPSALVSGGKELFEARVPVSAAKNDDASPNSRQIPPVPLTSGPGRAGGEGFADFFGEEKADAGPYPGNLEPGAVSPVPSRLADTAGDKMLTNSARSGAGDLFSEKQINAFVSDAGNPNKSNPVFQTVDQLTDAYTTGAKASDTQDFQKAAYYAGLVFDSAMPDSERVNPVSVITPVPVDNLDKLGAVRYRDMSEQLKAQQACSAAHMYNSAFMDKIDHDMNIISNLLGKQPSGCCDERVYSWNAGVLRLKELSIRRDEIARILTSACGQNYMSGQSARYDAMLLPRPDSYSCFVLTGFALFCAVSGAALAVMAAVNILAPGWAAAGFAVMAGGIFLIGGNVVSTVKVSNTSLVRGVRAEAESKLQKVLGIAAPAANAAPEQSAGTEQIQNIAPTEGKPEIGP
ncbi:MAG: hypothetical protein WCS77_04580 [Elusimicrobiaceae bacterium]